MSSLAPLRRLSLKLSLELSLRSDLSLKLALSLRLDLGLPRLLLRLTLKLSGILSLELLTLKLPLDRSLRSALELSLELLALWRLSLSLHLSLGRLERLLPGNEILKLALGLWWRLHPKRRPLFLAVVRSMEDVLEC